MLALLAPSTAARGAVTIGQTPLSTPTPTCISQIDLLQPTVTSATKYVVPSTIAQGTLTRWSHRAAAGSGQQLTLKVFRSTGGSNYEVVGHDGPRSLSAARLNTFPASIRVRAGDILGLNSANAATVPNACAFQANGDSLRERMGDLPDGAAGSFTSVANSRVNVSARIEPTNTFSFGPVFSPRRGFAIVPVSLPNPGRLSVSGRGVGSSVHRTLSLSGPGTFDVAIWATGQKRRRLKRRGRVLVAPSFRYTPTSGARRTQSLTVMLKKKHRRHHRHKRR